MSLPFYTVTMEQEDWDKRKTQQMSSKYMLEHEVHCDVAFRVGETGDLINAHRLFLAQRTHVFDQMLYGPDPETKSAILIEDVEPAAFRAVLRYCYYDCVEVEPDHALPTLAAAKKFKLPSLVEACRTILIKNLSPENVWKIYSSSLQDDEKGILEGCRRYFCRGVSAVKDALESPTFLEVSKDVLFDLLTMNDSKCEVIKCNIQSLVTDIGNGDWGKLSRSGEVLKLLELSKALEEKAAKEGQDEASKPVKYGTVVAEVELWKAVHRWAEEECARQGIEPSGPNKRNVLGDCLYLIRFSVMLLEDLVNVVIPSNVLTEEEQFDLLEHAHSDSVYRTPPPFLATKHKYLVKFVPELSALCFKEYSPFLKSNTEYCSLEIVPKERLLLTGIQVKCFYKPFAPAEHEVTVMSKEKAWCNSLTSVEVEGTATDDESIHYFELEEIKLEAETTYVIKVQMVRKPRASGEFYYRTWKEFFYDTKVPGDLNVEVTKADNNVSIVGLVVRLV